MKSAVLSSLLLLSRLSLNAGVRPVGPHWYVAHVTGSAGVSVDLGPFRKLPNAEKFCVTVRQRMSGNRCQVVPVVGPAEWSKQGVK